MGKKMKFVTLTTSILCLAVLMPFMGLRAQNVSKVGTTTAQFLQIGVGSRAVAMGGAYVAVSDDASGLYWNAAGITGLENNEIITSHSEWLAGIDFDYVGAVFNIKDAGHIGVSLTMLGVPEMLVRTEDYQEGTGETFDAADLAFGITYAQNVGSRFSVGGTVKFIQQRIWHTKAHAFAFDLGTKYKTDFLGGLIIGTSISNFGSEMQMYGRDLRRFLDPDPTSDGNNDQIPVNFETDKWSLPVNFQFGVALEPLKTRMHRVLIAIDALHPSSNYESVNVGGEYAFQERVFFRAGYESLFLDDVEAGINAGMGVNQQLSNGLLAKLSYAYKTAGRLGNIHNLTLQVGFK